MNKRGFTLIEVIAVILLIGLLASIGIISYRRFFKSAEDSYYEVIENNMKIAGNDYFTDHRDELPTGLDYKEVTLVDLVESKYIDPVHDANGKLCTSDGVYVYRENNSYRYEACLICGNYVSDFCNQIDRASKEITITGRIVGGENYDVLKSYSSQVPTPGENVITTFSMDEQYNVSKYIVSHVAGEVSDIECTELNNNTCSVEIGTSGTYKVTAYDEDDKVISSRYMSVRIGIKDHLWYNYNLFAATTQTTNEVKATYTEDGSYLTLNGTGTAKSIIPKLWDYEKRNFTAGDEYQLTIKYISGTMTRASSSVNYPKLVIDMTTDGARFSDRTTAPVSAWGLQFPTSGEESLSFTIDASRTSANGLQYWIWEDSIGNATFTDYKVQILITKVDEKTVTNDLDNVFLPTPTKTGYDFAGWWTSPSGGTEVTNETTYNMLDTKTLYAHWTSHKLIIQYNGNASDANLCETHGESYTLDSSKYVIYNSSRNVSTKEFGQTVDLLNYNNSSALCIERTGYNAPSGAQWSMNGNSSKTYSHSGAIDINTMASDGGCNLETSSSCTVRLDVNWTVKQYTVTYVDNLFVGRNQSVDGITAVYTENGSYLTLNGITSNKWILDKLWAYERRTINAGDQYKITIKYISGSYTGKVDTTQKPRFYFELSNDGEVFSDRTTAPTSYKLVEMPLSGENSATFAVDASRASANGLNYRVYQQTASNFEFTDYKVQIIITKVRTKTVTFGSTYGTLATNSKTGFDFDGWHTGLTDGTEITSSSTYNTDGNQTLYAHWTYHKLHVRYRANNSGVTWCGSSSSTHSMDSSKYALNSSGSRDITNPGYGQYISYKSGFADYHNASAICFNRSGYKGVSGKEWKLTYDGTTTYYNQATKTYTAASVATKGGCSLKNTASCTVTVNVNWESTSSGGGSDPTPTSSSGTTCTDEMACGGLGSWCHYGNLCYYAKIDANFPTCESEGCTWVCGSCYCSVGNAACK